MFDILSKNKHQILVFLLWTSFLTAQIVLLYPWMYTAFDAIVCKPYGTLNFMSISCTCPSTLQGPTCRECKINPKYGKCTGLSYECNGLRKGPLCETCMGELLEGDCGSTCDNTQGYYTYRSTCRYCDNNLTCSGHGVCQVPEGICQCNDGWAQSRIGEQCNAQCPIGSNGLACSGHGTCKRGGECQCASPYCGSSCQTLLVQNEDELESNLQWCYGNGIPNLQIDGDCSCKCNVDPFNRDLAIDSPDRTNLCKYRCPVGSDGHVCGSTALATVFKDNKCQCKCGDGKLRPAACDTDCAFGGSEDASGNCVCLFPNQDGSYPAFCSTCKPEYFIPETGCQQHCVDSITCPTGYCAIDSNNRFHVTCQGCSIHHKGEILPFVLQSNEAFSTSNSNGALDIAYAVSLSKEETRVAILTPQPTSKKSSRIFHYSPQRIVVELSELDSATVAVTSKDGNMSTVPYQLSLPVAYTVTTQQLYGLELTRSTTLSVAEECIQRSPLCQAYTLQPDNLYQSVSTSDMSGPVIVGNERFLVASHALLPAKHYYKVVFEDTVLRGCSKCNDDFYPEPALTPFGEQSCNIFCNSATCHYQGVCTTLGKCQCNFPNMDETCSKCLPHFYPEPGINVSTPCNQACYETSMPSAKTSGLIFQNSSTCSNHGVCDEYGKCRCSNTLNGPANGFIGESCQFACNPTHGSNEVCSGHGSCQNGQCVQCDAGYFGTQCEVTCSRADQSFWRLQQNGILSGAQNNVPCGVNQKCSKSICNGEFNQCLRTYQYTHEQQFISYKICDASTDANNKEHPLLECTGFTAETYPYNAADGKEKLGQNYGIYCEVDVSADATEQSSRYGVCAQTVCNCRSIATSVVSDGKKMSVQIGTPLAGSACHLTGCQRSEFSDVSTWTSFCGEYPPPRVQSPSLYLYSDRNNVLTTGKAALENALTFYAQECSHGTCGALNNNATHRGTQENPAPADVDGIQGTCKCKQTAQKNGFGTYLDFNHTVQQVSCESNSGSRAVGWPEACCGQYDSFGKEPYFGNGCANQCMCNDGQYWKGTCSISLQGTNVQMGVGCNCRNGYHEQLPASSRTRLFCGTTCDNVCKGIVKSTGEPVINLRSLCPSNLALASTPDQQKGCYDGLLPCNGHGHCSHNSGQCVLTSRQYNLGQANCMCWGSDISVAEISSSFNLPDVIALYGGEDCSKQCPGAQMPANYFADNYDLLHQSFITNEQSAAKIQFVKIYKENICSGHGYCIPTAEIKNNAMKCTCDGNWGGDLCNLKCELQNNLWRDSNGVLQLPFQDSIVSADGSSNFVENVLSENFGLHVCGPHATCNQQACTQTSPNGQFTPLNYIDAKNQVQLWLDTTNLNFVDEYFQQWSMAFVGEFSNCATQYYSSYPVSVQDQADETFIHALPKLVQWHLTRTCDTRYKQYAAYDKNTFTSSTQPPPWCCNLEDSSDKWKDDFYIKEGTHGGCPGNQCTNFATGRQCTSCVSDAFVNYMPEHNVAPCQKQPKQPEPEGYCALCKQSDEHHLMVYPYDVYDENTIQFDFECVPCFSNTHRLSGNQAYEKIKHVCNGHGTCEGRMQTFGGRMFGSNLVSNTNTDELLCGNDNSPHAALLGLCKCTPDFGGPTCAIPLTNAACNSHGIALSGYCKCDQDHFGMYCQFVKSNVGASAVANDLDACMQYQSFGLEFVLVECNDKTGNSKCDTGLRCQSCADSRLDEALGCREYKEDVVTQFIQEQVLPKRKQNACKA